MARILCDIDGTIADLHKEWLNKYNNDYKDNFTIDKWVDWNIHKLIKEECGEKIYTYLEDPKIYDNVEPFDDALDVLSKVRENNRIIFTTSCNNIEMMKSKALWMFKHNFLNGPEHIALRDFVVCHDKYIVKADVMIEDSYDNIDLFYGNGLLFNKPWNINRQTGYSCIRFDKWKDLETAMPVLFM